MIDIPRDPDKALSALASFARYSTIPETMGMRELISTELERLDEMNRREVDEVVFRQRQGACMVLEAIINLSDTAADKVAKIRANQSKGARS